MADLSVVASNPLTHWRRPRLSNARKPRRTSVEFQPTSYEAPSFRPRIASLPTTTTTRLSLRPLDKAPSLSQLLPPSRPPPSRPPQNRAASLSMVDVAMSTEYKMPRTSRQASLPPPNKAPPMRPDKKPQSAIGLSHTLVTPRKVPPPPPSSQLFDSPARFSQMTVGELLNSPPQRAAPTRSASLSGISTARSRTFAPLLSQGSTVPSLVSSPSESSVTSPVTRKPRIPPPPPPLPISPVKGPVSGPGCNSTEGTDGSALQQASNPISPTLASGARRQRAVDACLKAEREYISLLDTIAQEWFAPLKEILSSSLLLTLFGNFSAMRQFHHTFLPALEKDFTAAFIQNSEFLKMYCTYLNTFPEAVTLYAIGLRDDKKFNDFHAERRNRLGFGLLDFLIRLVRHLETFLNQVKEVMVSSPPSKDSAAFESAFGLVDVVTSHLMGEAQTAENMLQVMEVQMWLEPNSPVILQRNRFLVRGYGVLQKVGGNLLHAVHPRYVFLFNDLLIWATPNRQVRGKMVMVKGSAKALNGAPIGKPGPTFYPFIVVTPEKTITLMAVDAADREEWIQACNQVFSGEAKGDPLPQFHFKSKDSPTNRNL